MKATLPIIFAITLSFGMCIETAQSQGHLPNTSGELYPILKLVIDKHELHGGPPLTNAQLGDILWAIGFISGVTQGMRIEAIATKKDISCMDITELSDLTVAEKVVAYIDKYPKTRAEPPIASVSQAVLTSYPCLFRPIPK